MISRTYLRVQDEYTKDSLNEYSKHKLSHFIEPSEHAYLITPKYKGIISRSKYRDANYME